MCIEFDTYIYDVCRHDNKSPSVGSKQNCTTLLPRTGSGNQLDSTDLIFTAEFVLPGD